MSCFLYLNKIHHSLEKLFSLVILIRKYQKKRIKLNFKKSLLKNKKQINYFYQIRKFIKKGKANHLKRKNSKELNPSF